MNYVRKTKILSNSEFLNDSASELSNIGQLDGNLSINSDSSLENVYNSFPIPVIITDNRTSAKLCSEYRIPVRKTLKRNNLI